MKRLKFEMDLIDKMLVDLYKQGALNFYKKPSYKLTGDVIEETKKDESCVDIIFKKVITKEAKKQMSYYLNVVNFLISNKFVNQENILNLFCLQLTPKGVDAARKALENEWERQNKVSLRRISNLSIGLTAAIVIATIVNAYIAVKKFNNEKEPETEEWEQSQDHPAIKPDSLGMRNDSTIMY